MTRLEELEKLYEEEGWQPIRELGTKYGIPKPNKGWDEAIPLIVKAEELEATGAIAKEKPVKPKRVIQDTPWRKQRTDLHGNLIPNPFDS